MRKIKLKPVNMGKREKKIIFTFFALFLFMLSTPNPYISESDNEIIDDKEITVLGAGGIQPNLTRTMYPIILKNETNSDVWDILYGLHVDNIRILYYSLDNQWTEVSYQIDEKGYFRTFKYELGFNALVGTFGGVDDVDIANWARYSTEHRYVGSNVDTAYEGYAQPNRWEADSSYWYTREAENPAQAALNISNYATHLPGGWQQQLDRRIDWDDELVFYAHNGKQASINSWWNYASYPNRVRINIIDPVDGGRSWMYIYYNEVNVENPPDKTYYIPPNDINYVSWDKEKSKISAQTYELQINPENPELEKSLRIKWPGLPANDLYTEAGKQFLSTYLHIYFEESGQVLDEDGHADVWREGLWYGVGDYDEIWSDIGYGMTIDLDLPGVDGTGAMPGQDTDLQNSHRRDGVYQAGTHSITDNGLSHWSAGDILDPDSGDHDHDTAEVLPYVRGDPDFTLSSNEAAIDGPIRVILDNFQVQIMTADAGGALGYEEIWTFTRQTKTYYANMKHEEPYTLTFDLAGDDFDLTISPHFMFFYTEQYSDFVRNDPHSKITLGEAPNNVAGIIPSFIEQAPSGTHSGWPQTLHPDGDDGTNDAYDSGGGPVNGQTNKVHRLPASGWGLGTNPAANNPLPDWYYLSTSSGGAWNYVPYQEYSNLFTQNANRDLAMYWKDASSGNGGFTEMGLYGNDANANGETLPFQRRTVFGNFTYWESQREYARMKHQLNENVTTTIEVYPGGAIFEDKNIYINSKSVSGYPYLKDGDTVWIDCDMDETYDSGMWSLNSGGTTLGYTDFSVTEINPVNHIYRVEFTVDDTGNKVPPETGHTIQIDVATTPIASNLEEFYLDNTAPNQIIDLSANQEDSSVKLTWSQATDNGEVSYLEIFRNSTRLATISSGATTWTDNNVLAGRTYQYFIRVYDKAGHYRDSLPDSEFISLDFVPAIPGSLPQYFGYSVTLDWSANPGDTGTIDNYRIHWALDLNKDNIPDSGWNAEGYMPTSTTSWTFTPSSESPAGVNGTYIFRLESIDVDSGISIFSPIRNSLYDNEKPISATIVGIVDEFYPSTAEIPIEWGGGFDALSGILNYKLERSVGTSSAPSGSWQFLGNFSANINNHFDTNNLVDETWYWYRLTTYDMVYNYDVSSLERVHYHAPVATFPNLKLDKAIVSLDIQERGVANAFSVDVIVKNTGTEAGTVDNINLKFNHPIVGDVAYQYTIGNTPSFGSVSPGGEQTYSFTGIYAASDADQGSITIDANLQWETTNYDYGCDTVDTIYIRDLMEVSVDSINSNSPVAPGETAYINMTISNPGFTAINLTEYGIVVGLDEGWVEDTDYSIDQIIGPDITSGYVMQSGVSVDITFELSIAIGAEVGVKSVDAHITAKEVLTSMDVSTVQLDGTSFLVGSFTGPDITNMQATPDTGDSDGGTLITISAEISHLEGVLSAGAIIKTEGGTHIAYLELLDNEDNGIYTAQWNSQGNLEGTYYIEFNATDASANNNVEIISNGATITLTDNTGPKFSNAEANPDPGDPEAEDIIAISVSIEDISGVLTAQATIKDDALEVITTITLHDDGTNGDLVPGDGIFTGQWASSGYDFGQYNVDFYAEDDSSNNNPSTEINGLIFTLDDGTGPKFTHMGVDPNVADSDLGEILLIYATVTDQSGVGLVSATIKNSGEDIIATIPLIDDGSHGINNYSAQWDCSGYALGIYTIDFNAEDNAGNPASISSGSSFELIDNTPPVIENAMVNPEAGLVGTLFTISVDITDLSGIDSAYVTIDLLGGGFVEGVELIDGGMGQFTCDWDSSGYGADEYIMSINATSSGLHSYLNDFTTITLTAEDTTPPSITNIQVNPNKVNPGEEVIITCSIVDDSPILTPNITITGSTWSQTFDLINIGDNNWRYIWDTTGREADLYDIRINATDTSTNLNERSVLREDFINVTTDDFRPPNINDASILPDSQVGTTYTIWADVSDDFEVDSVYAAIKDIHGVIQFTVELLDNGIDPDGVASDGNYTAYWDTTGFSIGTYYLDIFANDTSNNIANLNNHGGAIALTDTIPPSISNYQLNETLINYGEYILITVEITDASGINLVRAYINEGGTLVEMIELYDDGTNGDSIAGDGIYSGIWHSDGFNVADTYDIDIWAQDASMNTNEVESALQFSVQDIVDPEIGNIVIDSGEIETPTLVFISVEASDNYAVGEVWATINFDGSPIDFIQLFDDGLGADEFIGDGIYSGEWDPTGMALGIYSVDINVTDASTYPSPNSVQSLNVGEFTMVDTTDPVINNLNAIPIALQPGNNVIIEVEISDNHIIDSVFATITNATDGTYLESFLLVDNGTGDDAIAGDGIYSGTWDTTGYPFGSYNISINATDVGLNFAQLLDGQEISLEGIMPNFQITIYDGIEIGYIGEDILWVSFGVRCNTTVDITNIELRFGNVDGINNDYFMFDSLNISLLYELEESEIYIPMNISYSIEDLASIIHSPRLNWYVYVEYRDEFGSQFTRTRQITLPGGGVTIYEIPTIESTVVYIQSNRAHGNDYLSGQNAGDITFAVEGTYFSELNYKAYINLTEFGWGIKQMTWDPITSKYLFISSEDLPAGEYDCSLINAWVNFSISGLEPREDFGEFSKIFYVDAHDPIILIEGIIFPNEIDFINTSLYISIPIEDDPSEVMSGIWTVNIVLQTGSGQITLEMVDEFMGMYNISISGEELANLKLQYGMEIRLSQIRVVDYAGNEIIISGAVLNSLSATLVDISAPNLGLESLNMIIAGVNGTTDTIMLDANRYVDLTIFIDDGGELSSGIYYIRVFYEILDENGNVINPLSAQTDYSDWQSFGLRALGNSTYYGVFPSAENIGFKEGTTIRMVIVGEDFDGNIGESILITLSFEQSQNTLISRIVLFSTVGIFVGVIGYRIATRKKNKIINRRIP